MKSSVKVINRQITLVAGIKIISKCKKNRSIVELFL